MLSLRSLPNRLFKQEFAWMHMGSPDEGLFLDHRGTIKVLSGESLKELYRIGKSKEPLSIQDICMLKDFLVEIRENLNKKDSVSVVMIDTETLEFHI
jgi:hypothetical protein